MKNRPSGRFFFACEKSERARALLMHTKIVYKTPTFASPTLVVKLTFKSMKLKDKSTDLV